MSQRVHQKKRPAVDHDAVSQKILDLHEDSPNFTGFVGGVEVGGLIITGKNYSQLQVEILKFTHFNTFQRENLKCMVDFHSSISDNNI